MENHEIATWLTPTEAALRLGVSSQTIREYIEKGKLRAIRTRYGRLIDPESVENLVRERASRESE